MYVVDVGTRTIGSSESQPNPTWTNATPFSPATPQQSHSSPTTHASRPPRYLNPGRGTAAGSSSSPQKLVCIKKDTGRGNVYASRPPRYPKPGRGTAAGSSSSPQKLVCKKEIPDGVMYTPAAPRGILRQRQALCRLPRNRTVKKRIPGGGTGVLPYIYLAPPPLACSPTKGKGAPLSQRYK